MHPHSLPLTIGGTVLKKSDDFDKLGVRLSEADLETERKYFPKVALESNATLV